MRVKLRLKRWLRSKGHILVPVNPFKQKHVFVLHAAILTIKSHMIELQSCFVNLQLNNHGAHMFTSNKKNITELLCKEYHRKMPLYSFH